MSVTEELRSELVRRGIGYDTVEENDAVTRVYLDGKLVEFFELGDRLTTMTLAPDFMQGRTEALTVEEAIEATVDEAVCQRVYHPHRMRGSGPQYTCSKCGYGASDFRWAYCPKCGRKYSEEIDEQW